jgi:FdhD protein
MSTKQPTSRALARIAYTPGKGARDGVRVAAEEAAIALVFDGGAEAVMMATPADLEDFGIGFALTEGVVRAASEIKSIEIVELERGIEVRMWLEREIAADLLKRRRTRAGPVGCGLCGIDSIEAALPDLPHVDAQIALSPGAILAGMRAMNAGQELSAATRAVHAAAFLDARDGVIAVREDVGRHNALDKLAGALARSGRSASSGAILLSSRLSVDLVQKAARIGAPAIACVSAPTALAVRTAQEAGIAIAAIVRDDGFEAFTYPERFGLSLLQDA